MNKPYVPSTSTDGNRPLPALDENGEFRAWLRREMPAGTVIGDPDWWAPRILNAVERAREMRETEASAPPGRPEIPTLRDWFAGQALAGIEAAQGNNGEYFGSVEREAKHAYVVADAMLAARERKP